MQAANTEHVREVRSTLTGRVAFEVAPGERGTASWMDVSRVGARMVLGRYLRPGRLVTLAFTAPWNGSTEVSLVARVVWCRQGSDSAEFHAGLQIVREDPAAALAFSLLLQIARGAANNAGSGAVITTVWPNFRAIEDRQPQPEAVEFSSVAV